MVVNDNAENPTTHGVFGPIASKQLTALRLAELASEIFPASVLIWCSAGVLRSAARWSRTKIRREARRSGQKLSGYGKDMSVYGLEDYTVVRHVMFKH